MALEVRTNGRQILYRDPYTADVIDGELLVLDGEGSVERRFAPDTWELLPAMFED